mgnify:CR=1 FL=1
MQPVWTGTKTGEVTRAVISTAIPDQFPEKLLAFEREIPTRDGSSLACKGTGFCNQVIQLRRNR